MAVHLRVAQLVLHARLRYVFGFGDPPEFVKEKEADGTWRDVEDGMPPSELTLQLRRLRGPGSHWLRAVGRGGRKS
jgi:hypothetical protein